VSVRRITFIGNHSIPDAELREVMITGQSSLLDFGSGGPFRQDAFERDVLVLSSLYYDRGFLGVQIATPRVMLTPDRKGIEITLAIQEGPRFKIRRLRVFEVDNDGREVERPSAVAAPCVSWCARSRATTSTAPSSPRICRRCRPCTATTATPTSRRAPTRSSIRSSARSTSSSRSAAASWCTSAASRSAATARRATR
jgi:hypothetical protein